VEEEEERIALPAEHKQMIKYASSVNGEEGTYRVAEATDVTDLPELTNILCDIGMLRSPVQQGR